jgi:hypothetical protein
MATLAETHGENSWFNPKNDQSQATLVYGHLCDMENGDVVTYEELSQLLGREFLDDRGPFIIALRRFEKLGRGTFRNVRKMGYRYVADWNEVKGVSQQRAKRAIKQVRGQKRAIASGAPKTAAEKAEQDQMLNRMSILESAMKSTKRQLQLVKREVKVLKETKAEGTDLDTLRAEVEELRRRVDRPGPDDEQISQQD